MERSLSRAAALCAALPLLACGGFQPLDSGTGVVQGRAVQGGVPVAAARVFLRPLPDAPASSSWTVQATDSQGRFVFTGVAPARAQLAINAGGGVGSVLTFDTFRGTTDFGDVELAPLAALPQAFFLRGIGFEEQLSSGAREVAAALFSQAGTTAYLAELLRFDQLLAHYQLVAIDVASGTRRVLVADETLDPETLVLADDRLLAFGVWRDNDLVKGRHTEVVEVQGGAVIYLSGPGVTQAGLSLCGGAACLLQLDPSAPAVPLQLSLSGAPLRTGEAVAYDLGQALQKSGQLPLALPLPGRLLFGPAALCSGSGCGPASQTLLALDWQTLRATPFATPAVAITSLVATPDQTRLRVALESQAGSWALRDLDAASGQGQSLLQATRSLDLLAAGSGGALFVREGGWPSTSASQQFLSVGSSSSSTLPSEVAAGPYQVSPCLSAVLCSEAVLSDGALRLVQGFLALGTDRVAVVLDYPPGKPPLGRLLAYDDVGVQREPLPAELFQWSPDAAQEVLVARPSRFDPRQLFLGARGSDLTAAARQQLTFSPADHRLPSFSPDGRTIRYLARDPSTGLSQLYQVQLQQ
jgi:hypothetical protein